MKIALICFAFFLLYKCFLEKTPWKQLHGQGLARRDESLTSMRFISPTVGFVGAHDTSETTVYTSLTQGKTRIYKTENGGLLWEKSDLDRGFVEQIEFVEDVLFVLVRVHTEESLRNLKSEIWKSEDLGISWKKVYSSPLPIYIQKLLYQDKNTAIAIAGKESSWSDDIYVSKSTDGGRSWSTIGQIDDIRNFREIELFKNGFVYLGHKKIEYYDLTKKTSHPLLEKNINSPIMSRDSSGSIWLAEKLDNELKLIRIGSNGVIQYKPIGKNVTVGNPHSIHVDGDSISLFVYGGHSIFGVDHEFFHSDNAGVTWKKEEVPFSLIVDPCAYYGKELVWAASGTGSIQLRNPLSQ